jgi:hypothetical protein
MTKEKAIQWLEWCSHNPVLNAFVKSDVTEAATMAIEALNQQKVGHWEFPHPSTMMICTCSICHGNGSAFGKDKFCHTCGARMVAECEVSK